MRVLHRHARPPLPAARLRRRAGGRDRARRHAARRGFAQGHGTAAVGKGKGRLPFGSRPFVWPFAWRRVGSAAVRAVVRSEEHTSELQSLMRISYAVFCLKKKRDTLTNPATTTPSR